MTTDANQLEMDLTDDAVFNGRLVLWQPRRGYRFSVDAPLLIWFAARFGRVDLAADLGAGCGIVGLGLLAAEAATRVVGVEIQPELADIAGRNASRNDLEERYSPLACSMVRAREDRRIRGVCDLVVVNPPFWPTDQGRLPQDRMRQMACHEVAIDLDGWIATSADLLRHPRGRLCAVFPARRLAALLSRLEIHGLAAESLLPVFPNRRGPAELVLLSARPKTRDRLVLEPPLFMTDERGDESSDLAAILDGSFSQALARRSDQRSVS